MASANIKPVGRPIAPATVMALFATFDDLEIGAALEIVNDHDPKPLYDQFKAELRDNFSWACAENGPDVWCVAVRKLAQPPSAGECCGACGGA